MACERIWCIFALLSNTATSLQVELHGHYSRQGVGELCAYINQTSWIRAIAVCCITPLPTLAALVIMESIPLAEPNSGIWMNCAFVIRFAVTVCVMICGVMHQMQLCIPRLGLNKVVLIGTCCATLVPVIATEVVGSLLIGFPFPFGLVIAAGSGVPVLVYVIYTRFGVAIKADASLRQQLLRYVRGFALQCVLPWIYPALLLAFNSLAPADQPIFALAFPVLKIVVKNILSRSLVNVDDIKPVIVIFNIKIFHGMFVAMCMQNTTSLQTVFIIMAIDIFQCCVSLWDLRKLVNELHDIAMMMTPKPNLATGKSGVYRDIPGVARPARYGEQAKQGYIGGVKPTTKGVPLHRRNPRADL